MVAFCCLLAASLFYTNKSHLLSGCTLQEVLCKQNTYYSTNLVKICYLKPVFIGV